MSDERVASLDVVRGVAVVGILVMNIVAFGLPEIAYLNPAAIGARGPADWIAWAAAFILVDGKFRGLFSFLFGASIVLVAGRAEAKGENAWSVHLSRMAWLALFGAAHLNLVWWGDILLHYALVGCFAFACRRFAVHQLVVAAALLIAIHAVVKLDLPLAVATVEARATGPEATPRDRYIRQIDDESFGRSNPQALAADVALYRSGYATLVADRWLNDRDLWRRSLVDTGMETLAYMLLGMAALASGLLTGAWARRRYRRWATIGLTLGGAGYAACAAALAARGFDATGVALYVIALPVILRPVMIVGWATLVLALMRPEGPLTRRFAAAGRMAFSNYLLTSLICTTIFYGYGLGWYGALARAQLYLVALPIILAMLTWSAPWLARFHYGPLEWLWRSLARRRWQPMRKVATASH